MNNISTARAATYEAYRRLRYLRSAWIKNRHPEAFETFTQSKYRTFHNFVKFSKKFTTQEIDDYLDYINSSFTQRHETWLKRNYSLFTHVIDDFLTSKYVDFRRFLKINNYGLVLRLYNDFVSPWL